MNRTVLLLVLLCGPAAAQDRPGSVARTRFKKMVARIYRMPQVETWRFDFDASGFDEAARTQMKLTARSKFTARWSRHARIAGGLTLRARGLPEDRQRTATRQVLPLAKFVLMPHYLTTEPNSLLNRHLTRPYKAVSRAPTRCCSPRSSAPA